MQEYETLQDYELESLSGVKEKTLRSVPENNIEVIQLDDNF